MAPAFVGQFGPNLNLKTIDEINDIREELIDRFGNIPSEVDNLIKTVEIKQLAKSANIERIEAGAKGFLITFHNNSFKNVNLLMDLITKQCGVIKIRPDQKLFIDRELSNYKIRLEMIKKYIAKLYEISI